MSEEPTKEPVRLRSFTYDSDFNWIYIVIAMIILIGVVCAGG